MRLALRRSNARGETMKVVHKPIPYGGGGDDHAFEEPAFEFMLFRQDWAGSERVYFDRSDVGRVYEGIESGELPIHKSYSILYCRDSKAMEDAPEMPCYVTLAKRLRKRTRMSALPRKVASKPRGMKLVRPKRGGRRK